VTLSPDDTRGDDFKVSLSPEADPSCSGADLEITVIVSGEGVEEGEGSGPVSGTSSL
jgi:hypothetical protein